MFNKTNKPAQPAPNKPTPAPLETPQVNLNRSAAAQAQRPAAKLSGLGSGLVIDGNITGSGDLHLDGTVRGDVKCGHLIVGESGSIEGKVEADTIEVRGRIVGSISGKQVKLQATAYVEGDITHEALAIDVGAYFQGRCLQSRQAPVAAATSPSVSAPAASTSDYGSPSLGTYDISALGDLK
ncbi:hypothetical protein ABI_34180 [Asticcacaulis biprosthecium C19]|uniref:Polymer-forming cytoskeletal family protein n=1 Tax=Asticcacaulis biprosthecium C19 TaxID=715226 RepID=F4QQB0_9CAUL|nr:polymer-forming cytoskeletal protein [Asticcacaulis biprosthecium]EGF90397.1 hypothetical protein ABI_34180 [Asticcacaulis biprosthecium C19]